MRGIDILTYVVDISKEEASKLGLFTSVLGHVGDGNFHQIVMYNPSEEKDRKATQDCVNGMMDRALEMEGTVSVGVSPLVGLIAVANLSSTGRTWNWPWKEGQTGSVMTVSAPANNSQHCLAKELGPATIGVMKALKETLDPQ